MFIFGWTTPLMLENVILDQTTLYNIKHNQYKKLSKMNRLFYIENNSAGQTDDPSSLLQLLLWHFCDIMNVHNVFWAVRWVTVPICSGKHGNHNSKYKSGWNQYSGYESFISPQVHHLLVHSRFLTFFSLKLKWTQNILRLWIS